MGHFLFVMEILVIRIIIVDDKYHTPGVIDWEMAFVGPW